VRTLAFPVIKGRLGQPLTHRPALELRNGEATTLADHQQRARELIEDVEPDLKEYLTDHAARLTKNLRRQLEEAGKATRAQEEERYRSRQGEVSTLIAENTLAKLKREIAKLKVQRQQGLLFDEARQLEAIDRSIQEKKEEMARRTRHYEEVRTQLEHERERILKRLLAKRHAMAGTAQVFPVCVEVRLPGGVS
jgi:vacuolar-type H+-ATPase subunit I/STV1